MITIDWSLLVSAGVFLLTLYALNRLLFQPLFAVLEARREATAGMRERAARSLQEYESRLAEYHRRIREEKQAGYRLAESVRKQVLEERQSRLSEARIRAEEELQRARNELQAEVDRARRELGNEAQEIAALITSRVLQRG